jgi:hypothetical protein
MTDQLSALAPDMITPENVEQLLKTLVSREEAAIILKTSLTHFASMVAQGFAPEPYRFGHRCVMYSRRQIEELATQRHKAMTVLQAERDAEIKAAAKKAARAKVFA